MQELGYTRPGGMSVSPLDFAEIDAWRRLTCVPLSHWEASALRRLSVEFVASLRAGEDPAAASPYLGNIEKRRQETDSFFRQLASRHNGK